MAKVNCLVGQSGTGKSAALAALMAHLYETEGWKSRVIIGDGSRATYEEAGLIDAGVIEALDFSIREWPLTTCQRLCSGWWPVDVNDPKSELLPPTPESLKHLGVFGIEGLSVMGTYIMGDMKGGLAEQSARGIKIGQDSPVNTRDVLFDATGKAIKDSGPGTTFGGNPMSHFGFGQRRMVGYIEATKAFPNLVFWTAHERSTQDKISGEKLVGPEVIGDAMTATITRQFNDTLHFVTASKKKDKKKDSHTEQLITELDVEYRMYTRDHFHPDGNTFVKYKAVTRGSSEAEGMPLYFESDIPGQVLLDYYQKVKELRMAKVERLKGARPTELSKLLKGEAA